MMSHTNIWHSLEVACWARDLDYADYLRYHQQNKETYTPFAEDEYKALCNVFETNMMREMSISLEEYDAKF